MRKENEKLRQWQRRLTEGDLAYAPEVAKMNEREAVYSGLDELEPLVPGDTGKDGEKLRTSHVRNITFENIESQISSEILQPKVTPRRKKDERLANVIEHFIRNELDRLPFETINDMAERTVPIQGGVGFLCDWDSRKRSFDHVGEFVLNLLHPKQFVPQPGVYTDVEDMDWFIVKVPTTKSAIKARYDKDVADQGESEPEIRASGNEAPNDDAVTQYVGFLRNPKGGIDRYSWVNDVELEDLEDYQARRQPVCSRCGRVRPLRGQLLPRMPQAASEVPEDSTQAEAAQQMVQLLAGQYMDPNAPEGLEGIPLGQQKPQQYDSDLCPWCGCKDFVDKPQEFEQVIAPIKTVMGNEIPGGSWHIDEQEGVVWSGTQIPFYKPDVYPIVIQRSVSVYGQLLGNSDVDVIRDQQNTINRLEQKIIDRLISAGSVISLPPQGAFKIDPKDGKKIYLQKPEYRNAIGVHTFSGDLHYELSYMAQVYEEARQILGITDSLQGRRDPTATSAVAKEFSAAQAAGRMESKRVMKKAAYAKLFELMFKYQLAYSDEPIPVSYKDAQGETVYEEFNRYDFLEQDADGQWHWNDQFLFSCDTTAPLASNRAAMWQETRMNLQTGAFGDPTSLDTLILFWAKMEELHYPGAAATKKHLEERAKKEQTLMQALQSTQVPGQGIAPAGMPQAPAVEAPL